MSETLKIQGIKEKKKGIFYEVSMDEEPLGEGGMGKVYKGKCIHERTGEVLRDVAIKFIYDDILDDSEVIQHARREASIQLNNDNLVEMYGFIETEEENEIGEIRKHYHVVSEYLDGVTLLDLIEGKITDRHGKELSYAINLKKESQNNPEKFAIQVVWGVLSGIMALHDAGYIHRDIDPSNIMLTSDGRIKLIDYGVAKKISNLTSEDRSYTKAGLFVGKAEYAAPELVLGDTSSLSATTDIYAVGILLFQMVTGHLPFNGPAYEILQKQLHDKIPLQDIKNSSLRKVIKRATEKDQKRRYQSASEFRVALERLQTSKAQKGSITKYLNWIVIVISGLITGFLIQFIIN